MIDGTRAHVPAAFMGVSSSALEVPQRSDNVLDLFRRMVEAAPDAPAVAWRDGVTRYRELDALSNQVANALVAGGAPAGSIVAVFLGNPLHQIVATIGCMKAGCVFASLDASYPATRLRSMLEAIGVEWVILEATTSAAFSSLTHGWTEPANILVMGQGAAAAEDFAPLRVRVLPVAAHGTGDLRVRTDPDDPCYLYFTSGSTGRPKAIVGRTRGLAHFIQWEIDTFELGPGARVSQLTGPAFDVYLRDVFAPLCSGGTACIPPMPAMRDPDMLERWLEQARVTLVHCVPSVLRLLLRHVSPERYPDLRDVLLAGEPLPPADANAWIACFGGRIRLANLYGPTETTLAKFCFRLPDAPMADSFVPIGRPIPGAQAILLDEGMAPCAPGELGEICIRTPYRSLGYYRAPALNAAAFVPDPFSPAPGDVLYRTGDLARELPDGNFQFAGRKDHQVKIRGNRVEPGEVEARLREHPGVRESAVVAREDRPGDIRLVAYYVPRTSDAAPTAVAPSELRRFLATLLPGYMVPARLMPLPRMPLSANGKLDRAALPAPGSRRPELAVAYERPGDRGEERVCAAFAAVLGIDRVGRHDNFFDLGGDSLLAVELVERLQADAGRPLSAALVFGHPTAAGLAVALEQGLGDTLEAARVPSAHRSPDAAGPPAHARGLQPPIAIVAMAGRFPGARDVEAFWANLCAGSESITTFARDELDPSIPEADRLDPDYVPARGVIEDVDQFDAAFFGINPREAELMDPQHRIFLELCWECIERAGHVPDATTVPVGVFAGTYHASYLRRHVAAHPDLAEKVGMYQVILDNEKDYIATRIAHKLNLTGPAISLYTACSTSLVAICQAADSLRAGACDMALAGGISIICPPRSGYRYQEGAMFSPDGHTRTFDARAQGTVFSDGAGVVLLKRLPDAIRDGNPVHALILGGAVNNDGGNKASFTAPSGEGQAVVISLAQANARVSPRSIGYVEAHGTATPLGDPIEVEGLVKAFRRGTSDVAFCRIGSVKSNVGHLVIAAGAAGVIKTALSLAERRIPPSLHYERANPAIDFAGSPFVVNTTLADWPSDGAPRRAGVSSFGVGGTNAHVVMQEAPEMPPSAPAKGPQLVVLSARTPRALGSTANRLADHLDAHPDANLADVAWTLATGRKAFPHRAALVADDVPGAVAQLRDAGFAAAAARTRPASPGNVVFLFPGQGATYPGMGRELYASEAAFRDALDHCADILRGELDRDLRDCLFDENPATLAPTAIMQPATFAIEYALARAWLDHGLLPSALVGHSVGELVAATLAGVFRLADALRLVARRGALMQAQPEGSMLSVRMPLDALMQRLPDDLSLAAENAPGHCVVAGTPEAVARFRARLVADEVASRLLRTSHAFHSRMMEPVVAPFREAVEACARFAPKIPIVSTVTGDWLDDASARSAGYWARHVRMPVRFASAVAKVAAASASPVLLEVGPRTTLCTLARQNADVQRAHAVAVPSLEDAPSAEDAGIRRAAGQMWCQGVPIDPAGFDRRDVRRRLLLPTYPFERRRYWVDAVPQPAATVVVDVPPAANTPAGEPAPGIAAHAATVPANRRERLVEELRGVFAGLTGLELDDADAATNFMELGLDSLMLTQAALRLQKAYGVSVTFRRLMSDCATLESLAAMLDEGMPGEGIPAAGAAPAMPAAGAPPASTAEAADGSRVPEAPLATATVSAAAPAVALALMDASRPLVPGARLGREPDGRPAWFVPNPRRAGRYLKVSA